MPKTWAEFIAALKKAKAAGVIPLSLGEQWTEKHLIETVMIATLGPQAGPRCGRRAATGRAPGVTLALSRFKTLLTYTNSDAASLTWQDAAKLVADGKAAFNIMGDWQDGYFSGELKKQPGLKPWTTAGRRCRARTASTTGCPTASRCRRARRTAPRPIKWLGSSAASGPRTRSTRSRARSRPGRTRSRKLYGTYLKWALSSGRRDKLAGSLAHGVVATTPGTTDIDTALGLFLQNKDVGEVPGRARGRGEEERQAEEP